MAGRKKIVGDGKSGIPPGGGQAADSALWHRVTGGITPLKRRDRIAQPKPAAKTPPPKQEGEMKPRRPMAEKRIQPPSPPLPTESALVDGVTAGIDRRTATRLRRGRIPIEGRIDLHGMTQQEAHAGLSAFVKGSCAAGRRCVLVITGKGTGQGAGGGVLRAQFPRWLNSEALRPLVLSFSQAQPKDGGAGAFYVYLRRKREP